MLDLTGYGLAANPFNIVPSDADHWSGRDRERRLLWDVVRSVSYDDNGLSEFVILIGDWGSGKTHALKYLARRVNKRQPEMGAVAVMVPKVKLGPKVRWLDIYQLVVKQHLGRDFFTSLAARFTALVNECGEELSTHVDPGTYRRLIKDDPNHFINKVIDGLEDEDQPYAKLLLSVADDDEDAITYLTEGSRLPSHIDLPKTVKNDYDAVQVLAGIFRVMTLPVMERAPVYKAVHLSIDEVEELLEVKATEQAEFWFGARELINRVPDRMAFILALSAEAPMLEATMAPAVQERKTRKNVVFEAFSPGDASNFVNRQLAHYRPDGWESQQSFHPFTVDAVDYVLEQTVPLVPRRIFVALRQVLDKAIRHYELAPGGEVDRNLAEKIVVEFGI